MAFFKKYRLVIPFVLVILVGLALTLGLRKTVTLIVDGTSSQVTTYAFKVGDLLGLQHIPISAADRISPSLDSWLKYGATVRLVHAIPVQIFSDGILNSFTSPERSSSTLLNDAGIAVGTNDLLFSNGLPIQIYSTFPIDSRSISIQVVRSISFTLSVDGRLEDITSTVPTLGSALWAAGYTFFKADQLIPPADTPLNDGLAATLNRSDLVTIHTQAGDVTVRTAAQTVGDALESARLTPQGLDYTLPAAEKPIPVDREISLIRVTEQVVVEQTALKFETEYQPVSNLDLDSQSVIQPGEYGLTARRVRIRYENGQEVSRQVDSEWVAQEPKPRIIGYGTNVVMYTAIVDGTTIQYWRSLSMYATSYHPSEVGDTTASGLPLKKGVAAVDTSLVPFFTQMYVPGYGEVIAADRGGGVIGRWIDLGYSDSDYVPWHQWVTVYFLWPPPDNIIWIVP